MVVKRIGLVLLILVISFLMIGPDKVLAYQPGSTGGMPIGRGSNSSRLELIKGEMRMRIRHLPDYYLEIRTPIAIIGVRGTEFYAKHEEGVTTLKVFEGQVEFSDVNREETVIVNAGEEATAAAIAGTESEMTASEEKADTDEIIVSEPKRISEGFGLAASELSDELTDLDVDTLTSGNTIESESICHMTNSEGDCEIYIGSETKITYTEETIRTSLDFYWQLGIILFILLGALAIGILYIKHRKSVRASLT